MRRGDYAELKVKKVLRTNELLTDKVHIGEVLHTNDKEEIICVLLKEGDLEELSLDCIYLCKVKSGEYEESCTVRVKERFVGNEGKIVRLKIENGFYKINLKSVDKQIV